LIKNFKYFWLGFLCGEPSSWCVDIDIDAVEALSLADRFLPETGSKFGRLSKRTAHRIYVAAGAKSAQYVDPITGRMVVEIRSTGLMTVLPGSIHPSGETIEWDADGEPAVILAEELAASVGRFAAAYLASHYCGRNAAYCPDLWPVLLDNVDGRLGDTVRKWLGIPPRREAEAADPHTAAGGAGGGESRRRTYCLKALAEEAAEVAATPPGNQSNRLNQAARKLGELIQPKALTRDEVEGALTSAAKQWANDPEREPWTPRQIKEVIKSGIRAGMEHPRNLSGFDAAADQDAAAGGVHPYRLLTIVDIRNLPPVSWLIEGIIALGSLAVLYGQPAAGKTFLALAWALSVASGRPWLDRPVEKGAVLYISFEGVAGFGPRITAWQRHVDVADGELSSAYFVYDAERFVDHRAKARLEDTVASIDRPLRLIVIDTYARAFAGEENSAKDTGDFMAFVDKVRVTTGAAVLLIHHSGKDSDRGERGSTALRGAADTTMELRRLDAEALVLANKKQRMSDPFEDLPLAFDTVEIDDGSSSLVIVPKATVTDLPLDESSRKALEVLATLGPDGATATDWLKALGWPEASFYHVLRGLKDGRYISRPGAKGRGERYTLTDRGRDAIN
jgi:hypothetical protein